MPLNGAKRRMSTPVKSLVGAPLTIHSASARPAPPAVAMPNGVGVARRAPHPYAAVLLLDFMISEGQELLLKRNFIPTSRKLKADFPYPLQVEDAAAVLDNARKWEDLYQTIVLGPKR